LTYPAKHGSRLARRARLGAGVIAMAGLAALPLTAGTAASAATTSRPAPAVLGQQVSRIGHGLPWVTGIRSAATFNSYFLFSGLVPITAGGHTWDLELQIDKSEIGVPEPADLTVGITTPHLGGQEAHSWTFPNLPAADFAVNASKGTASASTGSALSPIASVTVAFKPSSHTVAKCTGSEPGTQTTYTGKLTGTVHLATGLHGLVLSKANITFGQPSEFEVSTNFCVPTPCSFADWAASSSGTKIPETLALGVDAGTPGHQHFYADLETVSSVATPKGTLRGDGAIINTANPAFSKSSKKLTVTTSKNGAVSGSIVIGPAKASKPDTFTCAIDGTSYSETDVSYSGKYTGQLEAHTLLTGVKKIGKSGDGEFDIITSFKKK
jgi:hypothetical protein